MADRPPAAAAGATAAAAAATGRDERVLVQLQAKFKLNLKAPAVDGQLTMTADRFWWVPIVAGAAAPLDVQLSSIKSQRWSKETPTATTALLKFGTNPDPAVEGGYMFVFSTFPDRDKCRDVYTAYQASAVTAAAASGMPTLGGATANGALAGTPTPAAAPAPSPPLPPPTARVQPPPSSSAAPGGAGAPRPSAAAAAAAAALERIDPEELRRRQELLQSDAKLRRLHMDLVMSGALTESEFWSARKALLEAKAKQQAEDGSGKKQPLKPWQRTGVPSAMLADVRPVTDGRNNKVTFNLNPQVIQQVFLERPAVHRAFLSLVPDRMSEKAFWEKYYRAELLFRSKNFAAAEAEAADDEELAIFVHQDAQLAEDNLRRVKSVDPTVDIAANDADDYSSAAGHGFLRDGRKEVVADDSAALTSSGAGEKAKKRRTLYKDINRHAAVVLEGRQLEDDLLDTKSLATAVAVAQAKRKVTGGTVPGQKSRSTPEGDRARLRGDGNGAIAVPSAAAYLEDLQPDKKPEVVELQIQDPRRYFGESPAAAPAARGRAGDASSKAAAAAAEGNSSAGVAGLRDVLSVAAGRWGQGGAVAAQRGESSSSSKAGEWMQRSGMSAGAALRAVLALSREISSDAAREGPDAQQALLNVLPEPTRSAFFANGEAVRELLSHFWASYPITSATLLAKAQRHKEGASQLYDRLEKLKSSVEGQQRHVLSQLLQPMFQALDAAFAHYESDAQRRAQRAQARAAAAAAAAAAAGAGRPKGGAAPGNRSPMQVPLR